MITRLLNFLDASPVNFLAVKNIVSELEAAGYRRIDPQMPIGKVEAGDNFCKADIKTDVKLDMGDVVSECGRYTSVLIRPQVTITNSKGDTRKSISFKR